MSSLLRISISRSLMARKNARKVCLGLKVAIKRYSASAQRFSFLIFMLEGLELYLMAGSPTCVVQVFFSYD